MEAQQNSNHPSVAVVILNYNGRSFLQKFLPSVIASTYQNLEIVIADNASTDGSTDFLQQNFPGIRLIQLAKNNGYTGGYNEALKQVDAEYYVLLNSDVEVTPGWIEPIITLMEGNKKIAACQPKLLMYDDKYLFEYAGAAGGWIDSLGYPFARGRVFDTVEKDQGQYDTAAPCFWASGAALFVRSHAFHTVGGFNPFFFAHMEEIDLCWRLKNIGYEVWCQPQSVVYHVGGGTLPKSSLQKTFLNFRNNLIMLYNNLPQSKLISVMATRTVLDWIAALKTLFQEPKQAWAVIRAQYAFVEWLGKNKKRKIYPASDQQLKGTFGGSIVYRYYLKKQKTFQEIVKEN